MFDKVKNIANLQRQAKELQKELEKIIQTEEKHGWTVSVTGDQKVRYIKHGEEDMKELTELINEAMKKVGKESAKKMMDMGGGLGGLLGGLGK